MRRSHFWELFSIAWPPILVVGIVVRGSVKSLDDMSGRTAVGFEDAVSLGSYCIVSLLPPLVVHMDPGSTLRRSDYWEEICSCL